MGKRATILLILLLFIPAQSPAIAGNRVEYLSNYIEATVTILPNVKSPSVPFTVFGIAGDSTGTAVTVTDATKGWAIETMTMANGLYVVNLGNHGTWSRGDRIFVNASFGSSNFTIPFVGYIHRRDIS